MSYELVVLVVIMLVFCFLMQIFTVKVMISVLNSKAETPIKQIKLFERKPKTDKRAEIEAKKEQERFDTIMRNLDAYDGSDLGQEEVK